MLATRATGGALDPSHRQSWLGREGDLARALERLASGSLAVIGPPGVGKTRLLHQVAVCWQGRVVRCALAGVADPAAVCADVARALVAGEVASGLRRTAGLLLVVDAADDAAGVIGPLVREWSAAAPQARVVVGSRIRPAGIDVLRLEPLDLPSAVALYASRASDAWGGEAELDRAAVEELVVALEGNPLALELAGSRARLFPPERMIGRIPDGVCDPGRPGPHESLEVAVGASWDRLDACQRAALAAASTFRDAFDADGFCTVAEASTEVLESLVDASLVRALGGGRLRLYAIVRAHAGRRADAAAVDRHAAYTLAVAEAALIAAKRDHAWAPLRDLERDLGGILHRGMRDAARAALVLSEICLGPGPMGDPTAALTEIPADLHGRVMFFRAGLRWRLGEIEAALAAANQVGEPLTEADRAHVMLVRAACHLRLGRLDEVGPELDGARAVLPMAPAWYISSVRCTEAHYHRLRGEPERAIAAIEAGLSETAALDPHGRYAAQLHLQLGKLACDEPGFALGMLERAAAVHQQRGDTQLASNASWSLSLCHWNLGNLEWAGRCAELAIDLARTSASPGDEATARLVLVGVLIEQRRYSEAAETIAAARNGLMAGDFPTLRAYEALLALFLGRADEALAGWDAALSFRSEAADPTSVLEWQVFAALAAGGDRGLARIEAAAAQAPPFVRDALLLLRVAREGLTGQLTDETRSAAAGIPSARLRLLVALVDVELRVAHDGSWFERRGAPRVDLRRRVVLRRLLGALSTAGPGNLLERDALVDAVWPNERMLRESADGRLYVAVNYLRRLGIGDALCTGTPGAPLAYGLARDVRIVALG